VDDLTKLMKSLFRFRATYRTDLATEEVSKRIEQLLQSKSRFLFFKFHEHFGAVSGNEFTLSGRRFDWWGMMGSRLKGRVLNENGTVVKTRITIPWLIVIIFLFVTLTSLSAILMADEITVNGEVRPANFLVKSMMVLLVFILPACLIFAIGILPAKRIEHKLIDTLDLKEYRELVREG
jgi:hypothetical protein